MVNTFLITQDRITNTIIYANGVGSVTELSDSPSAGDN